MSKRTGNLYFSSTLYNSGRIAGIGIAHDNYDDDSGPDGCDICKTVRVRMPHDKERPESLNGPVIIVQKKVISSAR